MARSRNIKPGFFTNEDLVELDFATRLLFAGLWTVADKAGRLEDRPKKIKMAVFPADDLDVDAMLRALHGARFISRYSVGGIGYIQIANWGKHQNPHHTEKESDIPPENGCLTVKPPLEPREPPKDDGGNPADSLIPDSLIPDGGDAAAPPIARPTRKKPKTALPAAFAPDEVGVSKAIAMGLSVSAELAKFIDHHLANGSLKSDWQATWRTWVSKSVEFRKPSDNRFVTVPGPTGPDPALEKIKRDAAAAVAPSADVRRRMAELTGKAH